MHLCAKARLPAQGHRLLRTMSAMGVRANDRIYASLIDAHVRTSDRKGAEAVAAEMKRNKMPLTACVFNTLMNGCVRDRDVAGAMGLYEEMLAAGVTPNILTFSTLLNVCAEAKDPASGSKVISEMRAKGIPPNEYIFATLLRLGVDPAAVGAAMRDANVKPNLAFMNSLIVACRDPSRAESLLHELPLHGLQPDIMTFGALVSVHSAAGNIAAARGAIAAAAAAGLELNARLFQPLMQHFGAHGDVEGAFGLLAEVDGMGVAADMFLLSKLLDVAVSTRRDEWVERALEEVDRRGIGPSAAVFNVVMKRAVLGRSVGHATSLLEELARAGLEPTEASLHILLNACAQARSPADAEAVFAANPALATLPGFNTLVKAHARAKDVRGCRGVLERMKAAGIRPTARTFAPWLTAVLTKGEGGAGEYQALLAEMRDVYGVEPDERALAYQRNMELNHKK